MKTWNLTILLLHNDEQKDVTNGYLDLHVNCISGSFVESLNMKMLLDSFEEIINLPSLAVKFCNGEQVFDSEVAGLEA